MFNALQIVIENFNILNCYLLFVISENKFEVQTKLSCLNYMSFYNPNKRSDIVVIILFHVNLNFMFCLGSERPLGGLNTTLFDSPLLNGSTYW